MCNGYSCTKPCEGCSILVGARGGIPSRFIKKTEILRHPLLVVRTFGWAVLWDCIIAPRGTTFLMTLKKKGAI